MIGVEAEAADGAIVAKAVLLALRVIAGEDDGDVVVIIQLSCAWRPESL